MTYKYQVKEVGKKEFHIQEVDTGFTVEVLKNKAKAYDLGAKLLQGAGFQGNTPPFICKSIS